LNNKDAAKKTPPHLAFNPFPSLYHLNFSPRLLSWTFDPRAEEMRRLEKRGVEVTDKQN